MESLWEIESPQNNFNVISSKVIKRAHNFATIDHMTLKLFCGDSISDKLSIHVSHFEIRVNFFSKKVEVYQFLVSKKINLRGWRHIYSWSTLHEEQEYIGLNPFFGPASVKSYPLVLHNIHAYKFDFRDFDFRDFGFRDFGARPLSGRHIYHKYSLRLKCLSTIGLHLRLNCNTSNSRDFDREFAIALMECLYQSWNRRPYHTIKSLKLLSWIEFILYSKKIFLTYSTNFLKLKWVNSFWLLFNQWFNYFRELFIVQFICFIGFQYRNLKSTKSRITNANIRSNFK
jgi:hypothetical protein